MRKFRKWANAMLTVAAVASLTACDDEKDGPDPENPTVSQGMYVLNNGNMGKRIEGDLTYYDYATGKASQDMFQNANKRSLGDTPQCAVIYGSKMYIGVYKSNVIDVIDRTTLKSIKQIKLEGQNACSPRSMVAKDGKIYISMYTGYVSRLDTLSCEIDASVKVGPNPEIIAIHNGKIYVPNSDGQSWNTTGYGTTATEIDIASFKATKTFDVPLNPCEFHSVGSELYVLCKGNYGDVKSTLYKVGSDYSCTEVCKATNIASDKSKVYVIDAPWGTVEENVVYKIYDSASGKMSDMLKDKKDVVYSPCGVRVDPITGDIFITSYVMDGGKVGTYLPGYCKIYDRNGVYKSRFETGVGPTFLFPSLN